jgi:DNA-directed RNA polymerase subunit RPC12/RpoP
MEQGEQTIMEVLNLVCSHCEAPLKVLGMTQYVTCEECSSKLEVRREGRQIYVDVLEASQYKPNKITNDTGRQNELDTIGSSISSESEQDETSEAWAGIKDSFRIFFCLLSILLGFGVFVSLFLSASGDCSGYFAAALFVWGISGLLKDFKPESGSNAKDTGPENHSAQ